MNSTSDTRATSQNFSPTLVSCSRAIQVFVISSIIYINRNLHNLAIMPDDVCYHIRISRFRLEVVLVLIDVDCHKCFVIVLFSEPGFEHSKLGMVGRTDKHERTILGRLFSGFW